MKSQTREILHFWGHEARMDGVLTVSCLSQWWPIRFQAHGFEFFSAEQYMMYRKAVLFSDRVQRDRIVRTKSPLQAMELGRLVTPFIEQVWRQHRYALVVEGNYHKFSQNEALKGFLLSTGESLIAYSSPQDPVWGTGFQAGEAEAQDPDLWRGENLLGKALMEVRAKLQAEANRLNAGNASAHFYQRLATG